MIEQDDGGHLLVGEKTLQIRQPVLLMFGHRAVFLAAFTTAVCFPVLKLDPLYAVFMFPILTVLCIFVFDDHLVWLKCRHDRWHLTNLNLRYANTDLPVKNRVIGLSKIESISLWFWWSLRLRLTDGEVLFIEYVRKPDSFGHAIRDARDDLMDEQR